MKSENYSQWVYLANEKHPDLWGGVISDIRLVHKGETTRCSRLRKTLICEQEHQLFVTTGVGEFQIISDGSMLRR
jgi:hypothetical protein